MHPTPINRKILVVLVTLWYFFFLIFGILMFLRFKPYSQKVSSECKNKKIINEPESFRWNLLQQNRVVSKTSLDPIVVFKCVWCLLIFQFRPQFHSFNQLPQKAFPSSMFVSHLIWIVFQFRESTHNAHPATYGALLECFHPK